MLGVSGIRMASVFLAKIISFLSPCVRPLVPGYVSYVAGRSVEDAQDLRFAKVRLATLGLNGSFVFGFYILLLAFLVSYGLPASAASDTDPVETGEAIYQRSCVACHGPDGVGTMPGIPDLTRENGALSKSDDLLIKSLINGVETEGAPLTMPAMKDEESFKEQEAKRVLEYIRREFGD